MLQLFRFGEAAFSFFAILWYTYYVFLCTVGGNLLTIIQAIILGLIQGLAEFLPISSSGHLAIAQHFFGINADNVLIFTILLHVGTLISVCVVYWKDILGLIFEFFATFADLFKTKKFNVNANATRRNNRCYDTDNDYRIPFRG